MNENEHRWLFDASLTIQKIAQHLFSPNMYYFSFAYILRQQNEYAIVEQGGGSIGYVKSFENIDTFYHIFPVKRIQFMEVYKHIFSEVRNQSSLYFCFSFSTDFDCNCDDAFQLNWLYFSYCSFFSFRFISDSHIYHAAAFHTIKSLLHRWNQLPECPCLRCHSHNMFATSNEIDKNNIWTIE